MRNGYVYCLAPNSALTGFTPVADLKVKPFENSETEYYVFYKFINRQNASENIATGGNMIQIYSSERLALTDADIIAPAEELATVEVLENANVRPLKRGERMFLDRTFIFTEIPEALSHLYFTQGNIDVNVKNIKIKAITNGKIYALNNNATSLSALGFTKVYDLGQCSIYPNRENVFLWQKDLTKGETLTLNLKWATFLMSPVPSAGDNLANIEGEHIDKLDMKKLKIERGTRIFENRHFFVRDDIPAWLYGKSLLQPKFDVGGYFRVTDAGTVYMLVQEGSTAPNGFKKLNYPSFELSYSLVMTNTSVYAKECASGEIVNYGTNCVPVFKSLPDGEYSIPNAMLPATVINLADPANEELVPEYDVQERNFQGCPTVAVTNGGRHYYGFFTGGDREPKPENYGIVMLGDETGRALAYDPLLVIKNEHGLAPDRVRVEDVQLWMQPGTNRLWIFWTNSGCVEEWNDTWNNFDHSLGVWASVIENPDVENVADLQWTAPKRISDGLMRNKPTVLANGDIALCAYDVIDNNTASVYVMKKDNVSEWIKNDDAGQWEVLGTVYAPENSVFDENQLVELSNGTLWMLLRSTKGITQSYSYDGGKHWSKAELVPHLKGGDSRFYVGRLPESYTQGKNLNGDILFVNHMPDTGVSRTQLKAMILNEAGEIVHGPLLIEPRACSYPDVEFYDGMIITVHDRGRTDAMELLYSAFTVDDILAKAFKSENSVNNIILSKSYKKSPAVVADTVFVKKDSDAVIAASLPGRTLTAVEKWNGESYETVPASGYDYDGNKIVISAKSIEVGDTKYRITAARYEGTQERFEVLLTCGAPTDEKISLTMNESDGGELMFNTDGDASAVFAFVKDEERDVLRIRDDASGWTHDNMLIKGRYYGDAVIEAVIRRDATVKSKDGFPVIIMRRTSSSSNHEQSGGGIGFALLKEGILVIYDRETSNYLVSNPLPAGLYKDNEYNTVKIYAEGNRFMVFVNGGYVITYNHTANNDPTSSIIADCGYVGVASSNGIVYVDSLTVRQYNENELRISQSNRLYDFSDEKQLEDFEFYHTENNSALTTGDAAKAYWNLDTEKHRLHKRGQTSSTPADKLNISSAYLKDVFLANFDMSVDFKRNTANYNWLTLVGRVRYGGHTCDTANSGGGGGFMATVQREGISAFRNISVGYQTGTPVSGYNDSNWHNLRVHYVGMVCNVYVDYKLVYTYVGTDHDALGGLVGLQSRNNTGAYSNFSVTALDINGNPTEFNPSQIKKIKVATVGDSITYGAGAYNEQNKVDASLTYPARLSEMLGGGVEVRNFGIAGRKAMKGADCFMNEPEYKASLEYKPDILYVMLGTNDIKTVFWAGSDIGEKYKADYIELIESYKRANPDMEIFLMTSPYLYVTDPSMPGSRVEEELVPLQHEIAKLTDCKLIDVFTATKDKPEMFPDKIHPSADGYEYLAKFVYEESVGRIATLRKDTQASETVRVGENVKIKASLSMFGKNLADVKVYYSSEDESVATVDADGNVTAVGAGNTRVCARVGTQTQYFDVSVKKHELSIAVTVPDYKYVAGSHMPEISTDDVHGRVRFAEGQTLKEGTHSYEWIFEPFDKNYYDVVTGTVDITAYAASSALATSLATSSGGKVSLALAIVFGCTSAALAVALVLVSVLKKRKNTVIK